MMRNTGTRFQAVAAMAVLALVSIVAGGTGAKATQLDNLIGAWKGKGVAVFEGNRSEGIRCNAYYTGGGKRLNLAVRCASTSYKIEIRSKLESSGGGQLIPKSEIIDPYEPNPSYRLR